MKRKKLIRLGVLLIVTVMLVQVLPMAALADADDWQPVGERFPGSQVKDISFGIADDGTPYIAYVDEYAGNAATVKKYNSTSWETIGSFPNSADTSLFVYNGDPYVAYRNGDSKVTVQKYDNSSTSWEIVGSAGFTDGSASNISLFVHNGVPYVAYSQYNSGWSALVKKYEVGSWATVGSTGFSSNYVEYISLFIDDDGTPYVAFSEQDFPARARVMRYDSVGSWVDISGADFYGSYTSLFIDGTTPYLAFSDAYNMNKATVKKYNGTGWENVGDAGFTDGAAIDISLFVYNGTPCLAFSDSSISYKATVKQYNDASWETVGDAGFSEGSAGYTSLYVYDETLYVAYRDNAHSNEATIMGHGLLQPTVPAVLPTNGSFTDTDGDVGQIGGTISWTAADPAAGISGYKIYWGSDAAAKLTGYDEAVYTVAGTSQEVTANTPLPEGATHFLIYSYNAVGDSENCLAVAISDVDAEINADIAAATAALDETDFTFGGTDDKDNVTQNFTLPLSGDNGTTITWSEQSDSGNNVSISGNTVTVTRPSSADGDQTIVLTATISKAGGTSETKDLTVVVKANTVAEDIEAAKDALNETDFTYAPGDDKDNVTQNFTLPLLGDNDTTVSWAVTSGGDYASVNGATGEVTVTRPAHGTGNATIQLTATISKNELSDTKVFSVVLTQESIALPVGSTVHFAGMDWLVISSSPYNKMILKDLVQENDSNKLMQYNSSGANNYTGSTIETYLNGAYLATLGAAADDIQTANWECGPEANPSSIVISRKIGLLTKDEFLANKSAGANLDANAIVNANWWLMTPRTAAGCSAYVLTNESGQGSGNSALVTNATIAVRPVINLKPDVIFYLSDGKYVVGAPSDPPSAPAYSNNVPVTVGGQTQQQAATVSTQTRDGKTVTTVALDTQKMTEAINSAQNGSTVGIPILGNIDAAAGELNGQLVKAMENKQAVLEIRTDGASYTLPASQINIDAISEQLGENVALSDIKVTIEIANPTNSTVQVVEDAANEGGFLLVVPPIEFNITCTYNDQTVTVSQFDSYVEKMVAIPDGLDPGKITTAVVVDPDGTVRHVPTRITIIDGKYYAKINSLTNSVYTLLYNPVEFSDVANHWAKDAVNDMGSRLVISGVDNNIFEPDRDITRAEFAAIIVRALGLKPGTGSNPFTDVSGNAWYCDYVKTAAEYNLITGYGNGKFGPNDKITREQAMTMVARAMKITGLDVGLSETEVFTLLSAYKDGSCASTYAIDGTAACLKTGVITGRTINTICPKDNISRAEVAVIVLRLLQKSGLI